MWYRRHGMNTKHPEEKQKDIWETTTKNYIKQFNKMVKIPYVCSNPWEPVRFLLLTSYGFENDFTF